MSEMKVEENDELNTDDSETNVYNIISVMLLCNVGELTGVSL